MGKAKGGFLTPKAIANRIKSKGLQKLRWYCQMCQKQCRDEVQKIFINKYIIVQNLVSVKLTIILKESKPVYFRSLHFVVGLKSTFTIFLAVRS